MSRSHFSCQPLRLFLTLAICFGTWLVFMPPAFAGSLQRTTIKAQINRAERSQLLPGCFVDIYWLAKREGMTKPAVEYVAKQSLVLAARTVERENPKFSPDVACEVTVEISLFQSFLLEIVEKEHVVKVRLCSEVPRLVVEKLTLAKNPTIGRSTAKTVLVAKRDLPAGTYLYQSVSYFAQRPYMPGADPKHCLRSLHEIENTFLMRPLRKGDFVTKADVEDGHTWMCRTNARAVSVHIASLEQRFADLFCGKQVNVFWTHSFPGANLPRKRLLLKNVLVPKVRFNLDWNEQSTLSSFVAQILLR